MRVPAWTAVLTTIVLAACGSPEAPSESANDAAVSVDKAFTPDVLGNAGDIMSRATAQLRTADGQPAGVATATADNGGVLVAVQAENLSPGNHGVHVHMTGRCDAPTFETAGSHWNPTNAKHGLENTEGPHAGDMPNLTADENGRGTVEFRLRAGSFDGLLDGDGSAFVVHAAADDQKTDPSGNSGDRIACGVFSAG